MILLNNFQTKLHFLISVFSCSVKALWHGFFHSEVFSLWPEVWDNGPPCALPLGKVPRQNVLPLKKANLQELKKSDASFVVSYNQTCSTLAPIFTLLNKDLFDSLDQFYTDLLLKSCQGRQKLL